MRLGDCLEEVASGVGADWAKYPVLGATRAGLASAKEPVGKQPERYKLVAPGTVFYNPMRILLGSIAMVDEGGPAGITSPDYVVFRPKPGVLNHRWLYYWLRSADGATLIKSLTRGAVRERLLFRRLAAGEISPPSYASQLRFAEAVQHVARARAAAEARLEAASRLAGSHLQAILAGGSSWPRVELRNLLASPLRTGISKPPLAGSEIKCLTLSAVRPGGILDLNCSKPVDLSEDAAKSNWVKPGAFYVVRGNGNLSLVGRAGQAADLNENRVVFPDLLIELIPTIEFVWPPFLRMIWDAEEVRSEIEKLARTSAGIHKINLTNLAGTRLPMPSLEEQKKAASEFETKLERATATLNAATGAIAAVAALPAALLRRAFSGEL